MVMRERNHTPANVSTDGTTGRETFNSEAASKSGRPGRPCKHASEGDTNGYQRCRTAQTTTSRPHGNCYDAGMTVQTYVPLMIEKS